MAVGRYFRGLTAYDLLGNLVPGALTLIFIMGFLPSPPVPTTIGGYGLFAIVAFAAGSIIQAHASKAIGKRENFNKTMAGVEELPHLSQKVPDEEDDEDDDEEGERDREGDQNGKNKEEDQEGNFLKYILTIFHALLGPLLWWLRPARGEKLDDGILVNRIWEHLVDTYEIPYNTESYSVLYHLMCSKVDDISSPSLATRIQAIRNFHRGMWLTSWYGLVLFLISGGLQQAFNPGDEIGLGIFYAEPSYTTYWASAWHLAAISGIGAMIFWLLFESSEEDYIEYLFTDYAVAISAANTQVSFSEGANVTLSTDSKGERMAENEEYRTNPDNANSVSKPD